MDHLRLVMVGHVDHGKSTVLGRLLVEIGALPDGKLEAVRETCKKNSKPFEYAFLLDALKDEQAQGITIDAARVFFRTKKRRYLFLDAPGHIEFLKNMITGAAHAQAAFLVIDAQEGVQENSKRHAQVLSLLGVRQFSVVVNKMDLVDYSQDVYNKVKSDILEYLSDLDLTPLSVIPVAAMKGANIASLDESMNWYSKATVLSQLEAFSVPERNEQLPFRMWVQDVYKFTGNGDQRRIIAGRVHQGTLNKGDEVYFLPSRKKSVVKSIEGFPESSNDRVVDGESIGFCIEDQLYLRRGELVYKLPVNNESSEQVPEVSHEFEATIFWMGPGEIREQDEFKLRIGSRSEEAVVTKIQKVFDTESLNTVQDWTEVSPNHVIECRFRCKHPVPFDANSYCEDSSRFVLIRDHQIQAGGIIQAGVGVENAKLSKSLNLKSQKWVSGDVSQAMRSIRFGQKSHLVIITGAEDVGKKPFAKRLESELFLMGRLVYFLSMGNILYGVDADIAANRDDSKEFLRRAAEISHLMLDAGMILLITAISFTREDLDLFQNIVPPDQITTVWIGSSDQSDNDLSCDLNLSMHEDEERVSEVLDFLQVRGVLFSG